MPIYDRKCNLCGFRRDDRYEQSTASDPDCFAVSVVGCIGKMLRIPITSNPGAGFHAHGDECEVVVKHGLCAPDGSPQRFTSKSAMAKEAKKRGLVNYVVHTTEPGTDKSKHTQKWY